MERNDLIFGIILPVIVVFVIVLISKLQSIVGGEPGIVLGLTMELLELVVIVSVPLALGLLWNQWAGEGCRLYNGHFLCSILVSYLPGHQRFRYRVIGLHC